MPMKNIGTLLTCMIMLVACSTATVEVVKLSNGASGFDVNCLGSLDNCQQRAKVLCERGSYRVHNTYSEDLFEMDAKVGLVMRLECLDEHAHLDQCSLPGVLCIL
jgi:hypothetical protein